MSDQMRARLAELRAEYETGQKRLQELMAQEVTVRETMLRISGAIQVLQELIGESPPEPADATDPPAAAPAAPAAAPGPGPVVSVG